MQTRKRTSKLFTSKTAWIVIAVAVALLALAMIILLRKIEYGLILLLCLAVGFLVWKAFVKGPAEELAALKENMRKSNIEKEELARKLERQRQTSLNITSMTNVLKVINHEAEFNFCRPIEKTFYNGDARYVFHGAINVTGKAYFGIDLEKLKYKIEGGTLYIGQQQQDYAMACEFTPTWAFTNCFKDSVYTPGKEKKIAFIDIKTKDKYEYAKADAYANEHRSIEADNAMKELQEEISTRHIAELSTGIGMVKESLQRMLEQKYPMYRIAIIEGSCIDESYKPIAALTNPELLLLDRKDMDDAALV